MHDVDPRIQPARVGDLRRRVHGDRRRGGGDLHDVFSLRGPLHRRPRGGARRARRERGAVREGRPRAPEHAAPRVGRDDGGRRGRRRRRALVERVPREGRGDPRQRLHRAPSRAGAREPGEPHLHVGDHRSAEGRDALAREPRLDGAEQEHAVGRARAIAPLLPAAFAHRRADPLDPRPHLDGQRRLLRRIDREGPGQPQGGPAHALLRGPAHLGEAPRRRQREAGRGHGREEAPRRLGHGHRSSRHRSADDRGGGSTGPPGAAPPRAAARVREAEGGDRPRSRAHLRHGSRADREGGPRVLRALDVVVYEGYGMSENTGATSINLPGRARFGSVGRRFPAWTSASRTTGRS